MVGTLVCVLSLMGSAPALARFLTGQTAPTFALKDLDGQMHDFANVSDQPLKILYFFDAKARISQEGLLSLNELAQKVQIGGYAGVGNHAVRQIRCPSI